MKQNDSGNKERLIIFGRYPVPGKAKTRLVPALGPAGAADFQRQLTENVLRAARRLAASRRVQVEFCFADGDIEKTEKWIGSDILCTPQGSDDLGQRMNVAMSNAFRNGCQRVVLVGTDIPDLTEHIFHEALSLLEKRDLVLNPTNDGGYCLVGTRAPLDIFSGITWGREDVLAETVKKAEGMGLQFALLPPLSDIDTPGDLERVRPGRAQRAAPYLSVVIPALNEADCIEETIRSAKDPDAEIIVVDGGSTDDTVARAKEQGARVIVSSPGRAGQQNKGAAIATGKILLFLHADTILPQGYVAHIYSAFMDPEVIAGAFRFQTDYEHPVMSLVNKVVNFRSAYLQLPYGDQGLFIQRAVFNRMDRFPQVAIAEDLMLVRRLIKEGKIYLAPEAVVTSGRRWRRIGILRTFGVNLIIVAGYYMGISNDRLALFYRSQKKKRLF